MGRLIDAQLEGRETHYRQLWLVLMFEMWCRRYLDGDAGDFVGALLEGGDVVVTGNAGNYAGIGMKTGTVQIGYSTGKYTGEGMRGGTLRVGGRIAALGRVKQGDIYEGNLQVFPVTNPEKPATVKPLTGTARHK